MKITYRSERRWTEKIEEARRRGGFTKLDIAEAASWPTCAVGEIDGNLKRLEGDYPEDMILSELGKDFFLAVESHDFDKAARIHTAILIRVLELPEPEPRTED